MRSQTIYRSENCFHIHLRLITTLLDDIFTLRSLSIRNEYQISGRLCEQRLIGPIDDPISGQALCEAEEWALSTTQ